MPRPSFSTVAEYLDSLSPETRVRVDMVRDLVRELDSSIEERISYNIIGFRGAKRFVFYLAGYEKHIGMYPFHAEDLNAFGELLNPYLSGKATLRFPNNAPLPIELIGELLASRLAPSN